MYFAIGRSVEIRLGGKGTTGRHQDGLRTDAKNFEREGITHVGFVRGNAHRAVAHAADINLPGSGISLRQQIFRREGGCGGDRNVAGVRALSDVSEHRTMGGTPAVPEAGRVEGGD